jgi:flotillin
LRVSACKKGNRQGARIVVVAHHKRHPEFGDSLGFKIVTGTGTFVLPGVQVVRKLSLDLSESELAVECVTRQGIPVKLKAVVIYKVGDDYASIANAARRFLDQQEKMDVRITNVFAGHLRAIIGSLTVEEIIRERDKLTEATRSASGTEMEKLGLVVDSLQIQEVDDPTGYIANLARPHAAAVMKEARIAQAEADREATQTEQAAEAAQSRRGAREQNQTGRVSSRHRQGVGAGQTVGPAGRSHRESERRDRTDQDRRARSSEKRAGTARHRAAPGGRSGLRKENDRDRAARRRYRGGRSESAAGRTQCRSRCEARASRRRGAGRVSARDRTLGLISRRAGRRKPLSLISQVADAGCTKRFAVKPLHFGALLAAMLLVSAPLCVPAQIAGTASFPTSAGGLKVVALGYRASNLLKSPIYNVDGKRIGRVVDIIITQQAAVSYFIVDVGGFLGIGAKQIAVPAGAFRIVDKKVVLPNVTVDDLKRLPAFHFSKL